MLVKQGFNRISSIVAKYLKQLPHPSPSHTLSFPSPLSPLSLLPPTLPCSLSVVQMTMSLSTLPTTVLQASLPSLTRWWETHTPNSPQFYFKPHTSLLTLSFPHEIFAIQLSAKKWNEAITKMHQENRYKQMVVYVEACESGSMFDKLLSDNINGEIDLRHELSACLPPCYNNLRVHSLGECVHWITLLLA